MESTHWMQNSGFLKKQLTDAMERLTQYRSENLPPSEITESGDLRVALMLSGFATLMYALQQQIPRSNREADRQEKAIKALTKIIEKDLSKTVYSEEIFFDILHSRTLGDVAYDRLVSLFLLLGVGDEALVSTYLPSFLAWSRDEVEHFRHELPRAGKKESTPKNGEFHLEVKVTPKTPPKKPTKKLGRNKPEAQVPTAH